MANAVVRVGGPLLEAMNDLAARMAEVTQGQARIESKLDALCEAMAEQVEDKGDEPVRTLDGDLVRPLGEPKATL